MRWIVLGLFLCFGSAVTARAAEGRPDPEGDIYRLLGKHLKSGDDALVAQARAQAKTLGRPKITSFVKRWSTLPEETRARFARVRAATHAALQVTKDGKLADAKRLLLGVVPDMAREPSSPFSISATSARVQLALAEREWLTATTAILELIDRAIQADWPAFAMDGARRLIKLRPITADFASTSKGLAKARAFFERRRDFARAIYLMQDEAGIHAKAGNRAAAEASIHAATAMAINRGDRSSLAAIHMTHGSVLSAFGAHVEAAHANQQAAAAFRDLAKWDGVATAISNAVLSLSDAGKYGQALELFEQVRDEIKKVDATVSMLNLYLRAGTVYLQLGMYDKAIAAETEALRLATLAKDEQSMLHARGNITLAHMAQRRFEDAIKSLDALLAPDLVARYPGAAVTSYVARARCLRRLERYTEAQADLERAESLASKLSNQYLRSMFLEEGAELALQQEKPLKALGMFRELIQTFEAFGQEGLPLAASHDGVARALFNAGRYEESLLSSETAMDLYDTYGLTLAEREGEAFRKQAYLAAQTGIMAAANWAAKDKSKRNEATGRAWILSESGRGRRLVSGIVDPDSLLRANLPPELREADATSRKAVEDARRTLLEAIQHKRTDVIFKARATLESASKKRRETIDTMQRRAKEVVDLVYPRPASLATIQKHVHTCCALISYHLLRLELYAFVVTKEKVLFVNLGDAEAVRDEVSRYLVLASTPGTNDVPLAHSLHNRLIEPFEDVLKDKRRLVVVTDEDLAFLPFSALVHEVEPKPKRLLERFEVVLSPSATAYDALLTQDQKKRGKGLVAVGDPVYRKGGPFEPLPGSRREVAAVSKYFPVSERTMLVGVEATPKRLAQAIGPSTARLRAIHFACHARIDARRSHLSGLVLSDGAMFDLDQIMRTRIHADLAVLSACDSARGTVRGGQSAQGFVRGFLFAGTPRIVVSNWRVADESTKDLMGLFYEGVFKKNLAPAAALRRAKQTFVERGGPKAHPYYWAPFVLWGLPN